MSISTSVVKTAANCYCVPLGIIGPVHSVRAGVCRPCVETELTATKKSATDGN